MKQITVIRIIVAIIAIITISTACGGGGKQRQNKISEEVKWEESDSSRSSVSSSSGIEADNDETLSEGFSLINRYKGMSAGITAKIINGGVSIIYDREEAVSILRETDYMLKDSYNLEGMSGICKGLFIGNVGQDYDPVLCCLMEDGGIEVIALYNALRWDDFRSSGRLPGYDNVVSVSQESVQFEDGGYITLFTVDAAGNKKEVDFNTFLYGSLYHQGEDEYGKLDCFLLLSMDWKIKYVCSVPESDVFVSFSGTCRIVEKSENFAVYKYEMREDDRSDMTDEAPDTTVKIGTFKMQKIIDRNIENWFDSMVITCIEGLTFHPGKLEEEVIFRHKYN